MSMIARPSVILCDIEGTILTVGGVVPGASEALAAFARHDIAVRLFSNVTRRSPTDLAVELGGYGIDVSPEHIITAPRACSLFLIRQARARCLLMVAPETKPMFDGIEQVGFSDEEPTPDFVIAGDFGCEYTFETLNHAFRMIQRGAILLALNRNPWWSHDGTPRLDAGGFVALLEQATGTTARVMGKPSPDFFRLAMDGLKAPAQSILVIGDDATTDAAGAQAMGFRSILVGTGKFDIAQPAPGDSIVCRSLADVTRHIDMRRLS